MALVKVSGWRPSGRVKTYIHSLQIPFTFNPHSPNFPTEINWRNVQVEMES